MIADAYRYAIGEENAESPELELLRAVDRFGAQAIFGRPLKRSEASEMIFAETIVRGYREMKAAENMNDWIKTHKAEWKLLDHAAGLVNNGE